MTEDRRGAIDSQDGAPRTTRGGERARVERTKASALWTAVAAGLLSLVVILIFVAQNSGKVRIHFLMMDGAMPLGVALLVSALLGALLMLAIGTVRILQLRRMAKRPELMERRRRRR